MYTVVLSNEMLWFKSYSTQNLGVGSCISNNTSLQGHKIMQFVGISLLLLVHHLKMQTLNCENLVVYVE